MCVYVAVHLIFFCVFWLVNFACKLLIDKCQFLLLYLLLFLMQDKYIVLVEEIIIIMPSLIEHIVVPCTILSSLCESYSTYKSPMFLLMKRLRTERGVICTQLFSEWTGEAGFGSRIWDLKYYFTLSFKDYSVISLDICWMNISRYLCTPFYYLAIIAWGI